jgi:hypothetical protein
MFVFELNFQKILTLFRLPAITLSTLDHPTTIRRQVVYGRTTDHILVCPVCQKLENCA